ncbi:MAG: hypothetical protein RLZZ360_824 [Candidatus Parcubacteria bacterium]|jgi:hypothetical protein
MRHSEFPQSPKPPVHTAEELTPASIINGLSDLNALIRDRLAKIEPFKYNEAKEVIHTPSPDEKTQLQQGRSLQGRIAILTNALKRAEEAHSDADIERIYKRYQTLKEQVFGTTQNGDGALIPPVPPSAADTNRPRPPVPPPASDLDLGIGRVVKRMHEANSRISRRSEDTSESLPKPSLEVMYQTERKSLQTSLEALAHNVVLPPHIQQWITEAHDSLLPQLETLDFKTNTSRYIPLRDKIKSVSELAKTYITICSNIDALKERSDKLVTQAATLTPTSLTDESSKPGAYAQSAAQAVSKLRDQMEAVGQSYTTVPTATTLESFTVHIQDLERSVAAEISEAEALMPFVSTFGSKPLAFRRFF